jgi:hypothetical protein
MTVKRLVAALAGLVVALGVGCSTGGDGARAPAQAEGGAGGSAAFDQVARSEQRSSGGPTRLPRAAELPQMRPSVIKTAEVEIGILSGRLDETVQRTLVVARRHGGFLESTILDSEGDRSGTIVMRVPATNFEDALGDIRSFGEVRREQVSGEDVGAEVIDLEARLRNWQSQEAVLLRLMDRARTVTDTIRVQSELSRVQLEIERLRGRLGFLADQTSLATITAVFTGGGAAPQPPSTLARAWRNAVEAALGVVSAVIVGAGFLVPIALLTGAALLIVRGLRPRLTP